MTRSAHLARIRFPDSRDSGPSMTMERPVRDAAPDGRAQTILVVDDEPAVLAVARRILQRAGYAVLDAKTADAALRVSDSFAGEVDLLLTDVSMPVVDGITLARLLRERRPGLKVIFMSGYTTNPLFAVEAGRHRLPLIEKPFDPEALRSAVKRALGTN